MIFGIAYITCDRDSLLQSSFQCSLTIKLLQVFPFHAHSSVMPTQIYSELVMLYLTPVYSLN